MDNLLIYLFDWMSILINFNMILFGLNKNWRPFCCVKFLLCMLKLFKCISTTKANGESVCPFWYVFLGSKYTWISLDALFDIDHWKMLSNSNDNIQIREKHHIKITKRTSIIKKNRHNLISSKYFFYIFRTYIKIWWCLPKTDNHHFCLESIDVYMSKKMSPF